MKKIPETMKALVAYGPGEYKLVTDFPTPDCGPDDIIIKTEGCGICAGDLKCQLGAARFWGDDIQPAYVEPPFIPGHELDVYKRQDDGRAYGSGPGSYAWLVKAP